MLRLPFSFPLTLLTTLLYFLNTAIVHPPRTTPSFSIHSPPSLYIYIYISPFNSLATPSCICLSYHSSSSPSSIHLFSLTSVSFPYPRLILFFCTTCLPHHHHIPFIWRHLHQTHCPTFSCWESLEFPIFFCLCPYILGFNRCTVFYGFQHNNFWYQPLHQIPRHGSMPPCVCSLKSLLFC